MALSVGVLQANAAVPSYPWQVILTVQCHENGSCTSRSSLGHWQAQ